MNLHDAATHITSSYEQHHETDTGLHGRWLVLIRVVWSAVALLILMLLLVGIPAEFKSLQTVCIGAGCDGPQLTPQFLRELNHLGLSLTWYAVYVLGIELVFVVVWFVVAAVIFWRKSNEWLVWFVSLTLLTFGAAFPSFISDAARQGSVWILPAKLVGFLGLTSIVLFFYLFPSGRFVPRWTAILGGLWVLCSLLWILQTNVSSFSSPLDQVYFFSYYGNLGIGVFAQIYRYVRVSNPVQKQQTKWVMFGFTVAIVGFLVLNVLDLLSLKTPWLLYLRQNPLLPFFISPAYYALMLLIPVSIGFAILRYRLYDIDILINRTLVYGTLTISLALVYVGLVIGLESLIRPFTGQEITQSPVIIVASTLAIAALFQPLRRRVQAIIDRRFYRRKYDAARTLAAFSATLRSEVDLSQMSKDLVAVVQETIQPAHISLWLRPPEPSRQRNTRMLPRIEQEERHLF